MQQKLIIAIIAVAAVIYFRSCNQGPSETVIIDEVMEDEASEDSEDAAEVPTKQTETPALKNQVDLQPPPPLNKMSAKYPNLDDSFAPFDEEGNMYLTQITVQGNRLTFHGDLLIGDLKDLEKFKKMKTLKISKPQTWPDNKVPFEVAPGLPVPGYLEEAIDFINENTNVKFVPHKDEKDFVLFKAGEEHCYSYVGRTGGEQHVYLSGTCVTRSILHELMHTLGFFHEQNREDRDSFVSVHWENIPPEHHLQFKKIPDDFMHVDGRPFNYNSIMLYPSFAFSSSPRDPSLTKTDGDFIFTNELLMDEEDINRINELYPLQ